jgi:Uma2 family endonuclease
MEITDINQLDFSKTYTYADYFSWKFQERVELLKGKIFKMSPAPNRLHQTILTDFGTEISYFLKNKPCQVFFAPFDVRLDRFVTDKMVLTVVQPDICVVCDNSKLDERGCLGAPELVIEILSPGNTKKEMKYKFELYEASGVQEYLIVDPTEQVLWQYKLENGQFTNHRPLIIDDVYKSAVLQGFDLPISEIFSTF